MLQSTTVALLLFAGLSATPMQAVEEDGIHCCRQVNGTLFFTDNPKHFPAQCEPVTREPSSGGLILVPGSALPDQQEKGGTINRPWRLDDWRLQGGGRNPS